MLTSFLFISVCFLAYANGANDNFKGVASLFGSGTLSYRRALAWATLTTLAGSIAALFLAQTLLVKFSGKGLAPDELIHTLPFMIAVAGGAGMTVILATRYGFPVSTTHALLGAMAGSTLLATSGNINLAPLLNNFVLPLLLSPFVALLSAALLYRVLNMGSRHRRIEDTMCLCVETAENLALVGTANRAIPIDSAIRPTLSFDQQAACAERQASMILGFDLGRLRDSLHVCSAGAVCFARGLNDTPKIAALLLLAPGVDRQWIIITIALAMLLGGVFNARRVAETMSHKITTITHDQGLSANLVTALLVIFASKFGMPVSTTHVSVGALFGIGLVSGKANTGVIASIALSWMLTLPCAAICSAAIYYTAVGTLIITKNARHFMTTSIEISESVRHYYGQVLQSSTEHPHAFDLDDHHHFETGRPLRVCGNTADMLVASRYAEHFQVLGDKSRHFGLFDCTPGPQGDSAETGLCC